MTTAHDGSDHLLTLGRRLRALREQVGLQGGELAHVLGWSHSKVSRIENARTNASPADVTAWVAATEGSDQERVFLLGLLDQAREDQHAWRQRMRGGSGPVQAGYFAIMRRARLLRGFHTALIPGMLQTRAYAHEILTIATEQAGLSAVDLTDAVDARMKRQAFLETSREFRFLICEAALRSGLAPPDVMHAQLGRLLAAAERDNVHIAILPNGARVRVLPMHEFEMFDDLVIIETISREHRYSGPEAETYARAFGALWSAALTGDDARDLIAGIADRVA